MPPVHLARRYLLIPLISVVLLLGLGLTVQAQSSPGIININFQAPGNNVPTGYDADTGAAYGPRDNGLTYGWRSANTGDPFDASVNARIRPNNGTPVTLQNSLMHLRYNECCPTGNSNGGTQEPVYWEIALENGDYAVTVSVGDANNESTTETSHQLVAEGQVIADGSSGFSPTEYPTQTVTVSDGNLTIDQATAGFNTKINYIEISASETTATQPAILGANPANGATGVSVNLIGISTTSLQLLDVQNAGVDAGSLTDQTVRLMQLDGSGNEVSQVPWISLNTTGGFDAVTGTPVGPLLPFTTYRWIVDGIKDQSGNTFAYFQSEFTTGPAEQVGTSEVRFTATDTGFVGQFTTVAIGPDGRLYATSILGSISIWDIDPATGDLSNLQVFSPAPIADRAIIGLEFDPTSTATNPILWVTHNQGSSTLGGNGSRHFTGALARLTVENHGQSNESWSGKDYAIGFPRSHKDHLTNSLELGPDGKLYLTQGSISAMGEVDGAWNYEPETLLSAAILRIDQDLLVQNHSDAPLDVSTGIPNANGDLYTGGIVNGAPEASKFLPNYGLNDPQLAQNGLYDPTAPGAPVTLYATGLRNAYDLLWHSNGNLYSATNGSAGGGGQNSARTPATPADLSSLPQCNARIDGQPYTGPQIPSLNPPTQDDLFFIIEPNTYYGHPNPMRCEWVLNGGNPNGASTGPKVSDYPVATNPDPNYGGVAYNFEKNKSPNGTIEYTSNTFNNALAGSIMIVRYSQGDDIFVLDVDADGNFIQDSARSLVDEDDSKINFNSPLDLVEDPRNGHIYVSAYQGTRIFHLAPFGSQVTPLPNILVSEGPFIFEEHLSGGANYDPPANPRTVTLTNNGAGLLTISNIALSGTNANQFSLPQGLPTEIAPGESASFDVTFDPAAEGVAVANLNINTNDPDSPTTTVELRGLGKDGLGGADEPSLQLILDTFGLGITVGDSDVTTTQIEGVDNTNTATLLGSEIEAETFVKAGPGAVTIEALGAYGPSNGNNSYDVGWYVTGDEANAIKLLEADSNPDTNMNRLLPPVEGTNNFDPGTESFGFYNHWTVFDKPGEPYFIYTEEALNTNDNEGTPIDNYVRVYPIPGEANAYVIAIEEVPRGFDYQDFVFIVRNVVPFVPGDGELVVSTERLIFDEVNGSDSASQPVTISNPGSGVLDLTTVSLGNSSQFSISSAPAFVLPGETVTLDVVFSPDAVDVFTSTLEIATDAASNGTATVELRGLGKKGEGGSNEPSLQQILDVYDIPVDVGDTNTSTNLINLPTGTTYNDRLGDEVEAPLFIAAGSDPVEIELLSVYGPNDTPVTMVGWYDGITKAETELLQVSNGSHQTLNPEFTGVTSFSPTGLFGFYSQWPFFNDRKLYTEDALNTFNNAIPHHVRVYELPGEANAYIVATEENTSGFDYQDVVFIVRNVEVGGSSGEINFVNIDWDKPGTNSDLMGQNIPELAYLNRWLTMSSLNNNVGNHEVKDTARLLIENSSATEPLVITALQISDTNDFDFYAEGSIQPPTLPLTIEPGGSYDLWIEFVHQGSNGTKGILYQETLTVVSTAGNEPVAEIVLAGGWQGGPEGGREISTDEVSGAFGFITDSQGRPIQPLSSEYIAKNDEVLSFYWRRANTSKPVYVRQLAAYHGCYSAVGFSIEESGEFNFRHEGDFCQSLLPTSNGNDDALDVYTNPAEMLYNSTNDTFFIKAAGYQTNGCEGKTNCNNHGMRLWPIYNPDGQLVPNTFFAIQDYTQGGCGSGSANCDYNDNVYIITNIEPVTQPDPSLQIAMATDNAQVAINQAFDYNVTVSNDTIFEVDNVAVTYTLPDGFSLVSGTFEGGTCAASSSTVTCDLGTLSGKAVVDIDLTVTAANGSSGVVSSATVSADGFDGATSEDVLVDVFDPDSLPGSITVVMENTPEDATEFTFSNTIDNTDFTLVDDGSALGGDSLEINFQVDNTPIDGFTPDIGLPYGDRGNGLTYGWLELDAANAGSEFTGIGVDSSGPGNNGGSRDRGAGTLLSTLNHLQRADCCDSGFLIDQYWEIAVPNGSYEVTVSVGDTQNEGASGATHIINAEGVKLVEFPVATGESGNQVGTEVVEVTDGRLTLDPLGGFNTKIQYVVITSLTLNNQKTFDNILKGEYTITETLPIDWTFNGVTCDAQDSTANGTSVVVNLQPGEDVTCTFTNSEIATPTISFVNNQTVEAGDTLTVPFTVTPPEGFGVEGETVSISAVPAIDFASEVSASSATEFEVTFTPDSDDVSGDPYEVEIFAELLLGGSATQTFQLTVLPSSDAPCSPLSTLPCDEIAVNLPFGLTFDGSEGGLASTGFTMVDPPSARLAADDPVSDANVPGFEPSLLDVSDGNLTVTSTKGIQFSQPSGTPSSTETNSQINALGVGFDVTGPFTITTTLQTPDFNSSSGGNSQQAGLWFGLNEDQYIKLVVSKVSNSNRKFQLFLEDLPNSTAFLELNTANISASSFGQTIILRMELDPTAGTVAGFYSLDGGTTFIQLEQNGNNTLQVPQAFFDGDDGTRNVLASGNSYAGVFTTHRRADANQTIGFVFEDFAINPVLGIPTITAVRPADGATDVPINEGVAVDVNLPNVGFGVAESTLTAENVYLQQDGTTDKVPANLGTSGGGDAIILQPVENLQPNTTYQFVINGVTDLTGTPFVPFTSTFTTGEDLDGGEYDGPIEFTKSVQATGAGYTSLSLGPDGKLYASTNNGEIHRWNVETDGSLTNKQVITSLQTAEGGNRLLIGIAFDPTSTANNLILWVSHTTYGFSGMPDWDGKISRMSGPDLGTVDNVVFNLPRSIRDHVTNGLAFGPDGALYVNQGSNSAMGAPDGSWGKRPERALSAAVLRIDTGAISAPLDVKTEDGGSYDPFAENAPVTVYAAGVRNAYDLVWHSNGQLYVPTNGSAAGGATPASTDPRCEGTYAGPAIPAISKVTQTQNDYLFRVDPTLPTPGYFGHPNPNLCNFVMNGGNPTSGSDPAQVDQYEVGTQPDDDYRGFAFNFELNKSPNGVIEYNSGAFGGALDGTLMVVRYSKNDDIIVLTPGANGDIVESQENIPGLTGFTNPLDLTQGFNGNIYLSAYGGGGEIVLLKPIDQPQQDPATLIVTLDAEAETETTFDYTVTGTGYSNSFSLITGTDSAPNNFSANVNFNAVNGEQPTGYELDYGLPYGDRGNGLTYGWVAAADGITPLDLTGGQSGNGRDRGTSQSDQRLDSLVHMQGDDITSDGSSFSGVDVEGVWEIAVPNGTYEVTVAAGDPNVNNYANNPEEHALNVEDVQAIAPFAPVGQAGAAGQHQTATVTVTVTDGKLTIDAFEGTNTKINYVDITGVSAAGGVTTQTLTGLAPGQYTITQTAPDGWLLNGLVCDGFNISNPSAAHTLNLTSGATVECVFNNVEDDTPLPGSITVIKEADVTEATSFDFTGGLGDFSLTVGGSATPTPVGDPIAINFQLDGAPVPAGYIADVGEGYGAQANNLTYGWLDFTGDVLTGTPIDASGTNATNGATRDRNRTPSVPQELDTIIHMQRGDCCTSNFVTPIYWEIDLPNGLYEVTVSVGDEIGSDGYDSQHQIRLEGETLFTAPVQLGEANEYTTGTALVEVTDGKLTMDPLGGTNTKPNYIVIQPMEAASGLNSYTAADLTAGTYNITELLTGDWSLTSATCDSGVAGLNGTTLSVDLSAGEDITCTFVNDDTPPANQAPLIEQLADAEVIEGETLDLQVAVTDADDADVTVGVVLPNNGDSFITSDVTKNSNGDYTVNLSIAPQLNDRGNYIMTITANDGTNAEVSSQFNVSVAPQPACSPISILPCDQIAADLPFNLGWDGNEGGLNDQNNVGTGFTMALDPSARLTDDGTPTYADAEGYEPGKLTVAGGNLSIEATKGIFYRDPGKSSNTNSQINALGVGFDATQPFIIETTLTDVDLSPGDNDSQQGGIWFGLDEDNYAKLVIFKTADNSARVQLQVEDYITKVGSKPVELDVASIGNPANSDITLRMVLDPATGTVTGFYSLDGGAFIPVIEGGTSELTANAAFFTGVDHDANADTDPISYAGLFTTIRKAAADQPITFNFTDFSIEPANPPSNTAPEALAQNVTTDEDTALSITLTGSDAEQDALTFSIGSGPANGTLNTDSLPDVVYTPNADFNGTDSFTFTANDGELDSEAATVTLTVNPVNDAPVVTAQNVTTDEDTALSITLTGSDAEQDALTFSIGSGPANGTLNTDSLPDVVYTPNADFNGTDSFTYVANDGTVDSPPATVTLTVNPVNDVPLAANLNVSVDENGDVAILLTGNDVDTDPLTFEVTGGPSNGTLGTIDVNGTVTYTPNTGYVGTDSFTYVAKDGIADSLVATVSITVNNVNEAPVVADGILITTEDTDGQLTLTGTDADSDGLTFTIIDLPTNGSVALDGATVTYTPNANFNGADSFTYVANDGLVDSQKATINVTVNPVNDAPTITAQSITTSEDEAATFALDVQDIDTTVLTYTSTNPANGTVSVVGGQATYTPAANFFGSDSFEVTVSDGQFEASATITINVTAVNDKPIANSQSVSVDEDSFVDIILTGSDVETSSLTFGLAVNGGPANGTISFNGNQATYTPNADYNGSDEFQFVVFDGAATSDPATVSITVNPVDEPTPTPTPTEPPVDQFVMHINAGGPQVTTASGTTWIADAYFTDGVANEGLSPSVDGAGDEEPIYLSERSTFPNDSFSYEIPVGGEGPYTVKLHFTEIWFNGSLGYRPAFEGIRVFDVEMEGNLAIDDLDLIAEVGAQTAYIATFEDVDLSDGFLSLNFAASVNNPTLAGIEIIGAVEQDPTETPIPTETDTPTTEPSETPTPTDEPFAPILINTGGPTVTGESGTWVADTFFSGGKANSYTKTVNAPSDAAIYQTERSGSTSTESFSYAIPLEDGTYAVNLHFAELWFTQGSGNRAEGEGKRVFNVEVEGTVISDLDPTALAGASLTAYVETVEVTVSDGELNILFPTATANRPTISGIAVYAASDVEPTETVTPEPTTETVTPEPTTETVTPEPTTETVTPEPTTETVTPEPTTEVPMVALVVEAECVADPERMGWLVTNENAYDVTFQWELSSTAQSGKLIVDGDGQTRWKTLVEGTANTVVISVDGIPHDAAAYNAEACAPEETVTPDPTTETVTPDPTTETVTPDPTTETATPDPTTETVTPEPTTETATPETPKPEGFIKFTNGNLAVTASEQPTINVQFGNRGQSQLTNVRIECQITDGEAKIIGIQSKANFANAESSESSATFSGMSSLNVGQNYQVSFRATPVAGTSTIECVMYADGLESSTEMQLSVR